MSANAEGDRVQFFDVLRAIAIILVIGTHYRHATFPGGSIGVSIFFCLSGYLITSILLKEDRLDFASVWRFLLRRFLRVYPAYVVAILVNFGLMIYVGSPLVDDLIHALPALLSFTYQRDGDAWLGMGVGVFWTLKVEFWFYVLMPLFMLVFGRGRLFVAIIALLLVGLTAYQLAADQPFFVAWGTNLFTGTLLAVAVQRNALRPLAGRYEIFSAISFGLLLLIAVFVPNDDRQFVWPLEALIASILTAVWLGSYLAQSRALMLPLVAWLGRISYSVYLLHAIPLDHIGKVPFFRFTLGGLLVALVCAVLMHYLIEKPFIRLAKRMTSRNSF